MAAAIGLLGVAACADLATTPDRTPSVLLLEHDTVTILAGETVGIGVTVLDQHGAAFEALPSWAQPRWTVESDIAASDGSLVEARRPGQTAASVTIAGLTEGVVVRVNPASLRLTVEEVRIHQANPAAPEALRPGFDTTVDVFLAADEINFYRPDVRLSVYHAAERVGTLPIEGRMESIPLAGDSGELEAYGSAVIPGSMVRPGLSIVLEADPERTIGREEGSAPRLPAEGTLALDIDVPELAVDVAGAYLVQTTQRFDGSVPLVAGRDGLLRVFLQAEGQNQARATVTAHFYDGGDRVHTEVMERAATSIPLRVEEGVLGDSWNSVVPGAVLASGLSLVVEAELDDAHWVAPGSAMRFPAEGALALDVRPAPPLWLRMIRVHQSYTGTTGDISQSNLSAYLEPLVARFPIVDLDADIRSAVYTTDARLDTQEGWLDLLYEIRALRTADGSDRYYYGVHTNPPGALWGGYGFIGWPAAIGHDRMPHAGYIFAHELGHNFSLRHAPCGGASGSDPEFPYHTGGIGVYGYDVRAGQLMRPGSESDVMSYCRPDWISDFHYEKAFEFRDRWDWTTTGPGVGGAKEPGLLVWGGVRDGRLVLEPAFELEMPPSLPREAGSHTIEGYDAEGVRLFSYSFEPQVVGHGENERGFSFAIPSRVARTDRVATIRLTGPEGSVERSRSLITTPPQVDAYRRGGEVALGWMDGVHPMALVRDAATGEILSFARNGDARVVSERGELEILLSDGVRTVRREVRVP